MSHFYGTIEGGRGKSTRCATKQTGLTVTAASWAGAVAVELHFNPATGENEYSVYLRPWQGAGETRQLATGTLGAKQAEAA